MRNRAAARRSSIPLFFFALFFFTLPNTAHAQPLTTRSFPLGAAHLLEEARFSTGLQSIVVETLAPSPQPVEIELRESGQLRTRAQLPASPGGRRVFVVPVYAPESGNLELRLAGREATSVTLAATTSLDSHGTLVALVGPAGLVGADLPRPPHAELSAGTLRRTPVGIGEEPVWPRSWLEWGAVDAFVIATSAWVRAPEEARRAVEDQVLMGATLVLSARNAADLREPTLARMLGPVELSALDAQGASRPTGPRLARLPFGASCEYGLGTVVLFDRDLSDRRVVEVPATRDLVAQLGAYLVAHGGALWHPASNAGGALMRAESGPVRSGLRAPVKLRGALAVASVLLFAYVLVAVFIVQRERARGTPLRAFVRVPAAGALVLFALVLLAYGVRGAKSHARALVFVEAGAGAPRGAMHTLVELTAGGALTFGITPRAGERAYAVSGRRDTSGVARWDGSRMGFEGVRLGLWESAGLVIEGTAELGEGVSVSFSPNRSSVTVRNGTPFTLRALSVSDPTSGPERVWRTPGPLAPGGEARLDAPVTEALPSTAQRSQRLFAPATPVAPEVHALLNQVVPSATVANAGSSLRAEVWALAERPAGMLPPLGRFEPTPGTLVLRIVVPALFEPGGRAHEPPVRFVVTDWGGPAAAVPQNFVRWTPENPMGWRTPATPESEEEIARRELDAGASDDATTQAGVTEAGQ